MKCLGIADRHSGDALLDVRTESIVTNLVGVCLASY